MAKHEDQFLTLGEIIDLMDHDKSVDLWFETMRISLDGYDDAIDGEDFDEASAIESDYIEAHKNDAYRVIWPEHVTVPKFNGDATYIPQ